MRLKPILILRKLKENNLNVSKTAIDLNISRSTVHRWKIKATSTNGYNTFVRITKIHRVSTKPHSSPKVLSNNQMADIINIRNSTNKLDKLNDGNVMKINLIRLFFL